LFWYYKAGFNAARLLEEDSKWESAVAIYDKLVAAGGGRSEEAKARLNNIRLEHFFGRLKHSSRRQEVGWPKNTKRVGE
jgi:hypothetical protein